MPSKTITFAKESPVNDQFVIPDSSQVTICLRSDNAYLKRRADGAWANARLRDRKVSITPAEADPIMAAIVGDWRIASASWGIEFSGSQAILIFDLEKAG